MRKGACPALIGPWPVPLPGRGPMAWRGRGDWSLEPGAWVLGCLAHSLSRLPSTLGAGSLRTAGGAGGEGSAGDKRDMPRRTAAPEQQQLCFLSSDQGRTDTDPQHPGTMSWAELAKHTGRTPGQAWEELRGFQLLRAANSFTSLLAFAGCYAEVTVSVTG